MTHAMSTPSQALAQARDQMHKLLSAMTQAGGSDLFISHNSPPSLKTHLGMMELSDEKLTGEETRNLAASLMSERQREEFAKEMACNFAIFLPGIARFRVSVYSQQQNVAMVIRAIPAQIPNFERLDLPPVLKEVIMKKRGLALVVGGTGSGKTTTLAALIDHRNSVSEGHIITLEDPVEYVHKSKKSIMSHLGVGVDTPTLRHGLKNALRQAPDVILIGDICDQEAMEHAIAFSEAGHLCVGTLHAASAYQAIERIINFFPEDRRKKVLMDLSVHLQCIASQRLVRTEDGKGKKAAVEVLINSQSISERIAKGAVEELKGVMEKSREIGMRTNDWALFGLYNQGDIAYEEALQNADSINELRLNIKLKSKRGEPLTVATPLSCNDETSQEEVEALRELERIKQEQRRRELEMMGFIQT